jgi:tetratricopeptide (TPR) repeat protein
MTRVRSLTAPLLVLLLLSPVSAQFRTGNLKVRVTFTDGRRCDIPVHIQLMGGASTSPVAETYSNDAGMAEFDNLEVGTYHLIASGEGIEDSDSGIFEVDARRTSQSVYMAVTRVQDRDHANGTGLEATTIAAADLSIPESAAREFDKATGFMAKHDWKKAIERLNKALDLYPQYAAAYNNLGVIYARLGERDREREALQKATSLNDHFAPAFVNLAKMAIADRNFAVAEAFLDKAAGMDPANSQTLVLLANVELLDLHYDQAIANCRKAHSSLAQEPHALAHYIAARAFEHENQLSDAVVELQTFLIEEPSGGRAEAVRKELTGLQTHPR